MPPSGPIHPVRRSPEPEDWPSRALVGRWLCARLAALAIGIVLALLAARHAPAASACRGEDLIARLAEEDPAAHAALVERAAATANADTRLWRVEIAGGTADGHAPSHLFGTYHDTEAVRTLTPAVEEAFAAARRLVVELTPTEIDRMAVRMAEDPSFALYLNPLPPEKTLSARLDRAARTRAQATLSARGLNLAVADRMRPWILFSSLGVPACQQRALGAGEAVLDQVLAERAAARGLPVTGLETYEEALGAFDRLDGDTLLALLVDALVLAPMEEDMRASMLGAYAEGRIGLIAAFAERVAATRTGRDPAEAARLARQFEDEILVERNRAWMARLEAEIAKGGAFVAVGALHLPGEDGLVTLLREAGYTVEPVSEGS